MAGKKGEIPEHVISCAQVELYPISKLMKYL